MANRNENKRFTDIIGEEYKSWENVKVILDGGTDTGKTYFSLNVLGKYAQDTGKKIVYLCNRSELKKQVFKDLKRLNLTDVIYVTTYQSLANKIVNKRELQPFDYLIVDECHYFTNDALFNDYTDVAYDFVKSQEDKVVIYLSATAKIFFYWLRQQNIVEAKNYFEIPKSYDYVEKVYFYDKKYLTLKIDEILQNEPDSKIIVFCNSLSRMMELNKKYGDTAHYMAAQGATKVKSFCDNSCIYEHEDGTVTFDKRILVATKVLDNGVNIKDRNVKHIFSEILDTDSAIQALGRKRKISDDDTCTFYIKDYSGQAIQALINTNEYQTDPVIKYKRDYDSFMDSYATNRKRIRTNKIFQMQFEKDRNDSKITYNKMRLKKYLMDTSILEEMKENSYQSVMINLLGKELAGKVDTLDIYVEETDEFLEYLHSLEGKWLYTDDRKALLPWFENIGIKLRREGINAMNGALQDHYGDKYKCRFRNKQLDSNGNLTGKNLVDKRRKLPDGTENQNRERKYWILEIESWGRIGNSLYI